MSKFDNSNAITWFEIPTSDFDRATRFYEELLDAKLMPFPGPERCNMFPKASPDGVGGCILQRDGHQPCDNGSVVYLNVDGALDATLERASKLKAKIVFPRTEIPGGFGFFARIQDSEGNTVGLHSR